MIIEKLYALLGLLNDDSEGFTHEEIVQIKDRLVPFADPRLTYEARTYEWDQVNAFSELNQNTCYIHISTGIWKERSLKSEHAFVKNQDELAAVIGHEMAHCVQNISALDMNDPAIVDLNNRYNSLVASLEKYATGKTEDTLSKDNSFLALSLATNISIMRLHEAHADYLGMTYMAKAGFDPKAAVRMWDRRAEIESGGDHNPFDFHSPSAERAEFLENHLSQVQATPSQMRFRPKTLNRS